MKENEDTELIKILSTLDKGKTARKLVQRKRNTKTPLASYIVHPVVVPESVNLTVGESCC